MVTCNGEDIDEKNKLGVRGIGDFNCGEALEHSDDEKELFGIARQCFFGQLHEGGRFINLSGFQGGDHLFHLARRQGVGRHSGRSA